MNQEAYRSYHSVNLGAQIAHASPVKLVLLLTDLDPVTAFSAVVASVNCMGPGLGSVGPASNYAVLTDFQLWVCTLGMLLGRLEILSFMALLTPAF